MTSMDKTIDKAASEAGKALSKRGASKGGLARASSLSSETRSDIARAAAQKRWGTDTGLVQATYGTPDHPLRIGDIEIPCYVLEDERRVLAQSGVLTSLGMSRGGSANSKGDRLAKFMAGSGLKPFVPKGLLKGTETPIKFLTPKGLVAYGYEAEILADICEVVLAARAEGRLQKQQEHIALQCETLLRGFAKVGIIALVDEATGYQRVRNRRALEKILADYISPDLLKWTRRFPDEYYEQLFRLRGLEINPENPSQRPGYIGHLTNNIIYARLAPSVLEELRKVVPKSESGRRKYKFHQRLTEDIGHPKLQEHLLGVMTLMRASENYKRFRRLLDRALPVCTQQLALPLGDYEELDDIDASTAPRAGKEE